MFYSRMIVGWRIGIKSTLLFSNMAGMMYFCKDSIFKQTT
ncbi:putative membrane protein [Bacteroides fragilis str. 2-F-2 |uniref:Putative membrane protein n=1 Tax=Bacteroides fragilis str. 2-F-2 \|nr:putative membrane protein [Bacteroides fragilis str. 1007-1-F \